MQFEPHLSFNGQCESAFGFYEKCLGGSISLMLRYGESPFPGQAPPRLRDKILYAVLVLGNQRLTGSDASPEHYLKMQGFPVTLVIDDTVEAERIFRELAQNGSVEMPLQETFWATRFGVLVDQFGTPWEINCWKGDTAHQ